MLRRVRSPTFSIVRCSSVKPLWLATYPQLQSQQLRWHGGHGHSHGRSHGHSHSHGHGLEDDRRHQSAADVKAADRITWLGVYMNVALTAVKGAAGVMFHSSGLLADAVHSASDLAGDGVTLVTLKYCTRPPDARFPYGYGKFESVGALSVSLLLVGGSVAIIDHSFDSLVALYQGMAAANEAAAAVSTTTASDPGAMRALATHAVGLHEHVKASALAIHPAALAIAAASVGVKEWLYRATNAIGQRLHSNVLVANAWHHRSDAVTSAVATAGIGLSLVGFPLFDPLAGMLVGGIILKMGGDIGWDAVQELCDAQLPTQVLEELDAAASKVVAESEGELLSIGRLRSRRLGRHVHVDLALVVRDYPAVSLDRAIHWKTRAAAAVREAVPRVQDITVELETHTTPACQSAS